jgi:hypothetical protein
MKLHVRHEGTEHAVPSATTLFAPWERLLLLSIELDDAPPAFRDLAAACFACVRHLTGRQTREDANRAIARARASIRELSSSSSRGDASPRDTIPAPPPLPAIQHELPVDDRMTIRVSPEAHEVIVAYARERKLTFEVAAERLLRTACRRRNAVNSWNRKPKRVAEPPSPQGESR